MDLEKVLAYLHRELETLDRAISSLERLEQDYPGQEPSAELMGEQGKGEEGKGGRRGRPLIAVVRKARSKGDKAKEPS